MGKLQDTLTLSVVSSVDMKNFSREFANYIIDPMSDRRYRKRLENDYFKIYVSLGLDGKQFAHELLSQIKTDEKGALIKPEHLNIKDATGKLVMAVLRKKGWETRLRY